MPNKRGENMIFAANFKMNHTRVSTYNYVHDLRDRLVESAITHDVYVFPPATALMGSHRPVTIGAQDAYPQMQGAYTGEIGMEQLGEFGINTLLIGHSERRTVMGESQEKVAEKYTFFKERNHEIIYCIGEPIEVREAGDQAVEEYLLEQFVGIDTQYDRLIIAYEPIWAIGTGRTATPEEIASPHAMLRRHIEAPLLYGGSVKPANIESIAATDNVDGVLVGGASLEVDTFFELIQKIS
jgi:triosephosphate isomerase